MYISKKTRLIATNKLLFYNYQIKFNAVDSDVDVCCPLRCPLRDIKFLAGNV